MRRILTCHTSGQSANPITPAGQVNLSRSVIAVEQNPQARVKGEHEGPVPRYYRHDAESIGLQQLAEFRRLRLGSFVPTPWDRLWRSDVVTTGIAVRPDPVVALVAALCDAAAARLAALAGSGGLVNAGYLALAGWDERPLPWRDLVASTMVRPPGGIAAEVAAVTRLACAATGAAPLVVDLAGDGGIAVVKVLCPDPARRERP